jgi:hypothetical protein
MEDHDYDETRYIFMAHPLNPRKNMPKFDASTPLPPEDPLNLVTVKPERSYR